VVAFQAGQVAEVIVVRTNTESFRGSGYQISKDMVLTAAHVVTDAMIINVRMDADLEAEFMTAATVTWRDANVDLAVLALSQQRPASVVPPRFARLHDRPGEIEIHTAGFPKWKMRTDPDGRTFRDFCSATGTVATLSNRRTGTLEMALRAPAADAASHSPWEGMSGAAVWAGDHIIGVVVVHHTAEGLGVLTGARIDRALRDAADATGVRLGAVLDVDLAMLPYPNVLLDTPPPQTPMGVPRSLRAYRVPPDWRPDGDPCPISDAYVADLGALLCLDRGPRTTVVAASPGTALAEALLAVEQGPVRRGSGSDRDFLERMWYRVDDPDADLRWLSAGQEVPGLVLAWPVGIYSHGSPAGRSAREICEQIRAAAPAASVVLLVEAHQTIDAIAAATRIGRELATTRFGEHVEVLTLVRPGDSNEPDPLETSPALTVPPDTAAAALMATVAAQMHIRSLPAPPFPSAGAPLPASADPTLVADVVVTILNQHPLWGAPAQEAHAIGLIRDYAPLYFLPLVRRHAAARNGSVRWSSLAAAATIDDYVNVWFDAAPEVGAPQQVPRVLRDRTLIEAVLLGLLRGGAAGLDAWLDAAEGRCRAAWDVARFLAAGRPPGEFLPTADAAAAAAAARAGQHRLLNANIAAPEAATAWWAALGRRPVTEQSVRTLTALSEESRRVAGFTIHRHEPDVAFNELAHQLRTAMWPSLPAKELIR